MYKVIKEFAGIKEGDERDFNKRDIQYLLDAGYIKPLKPVVKSAPKKRKTKIDKEAEKRQDKSE